MFRITWHELIIFTSFRSCITDMCDCPYDHECACESFKAYAHACKQIGISTRWEEEIVCPRKQIFILSFTCSVIFCSLWERFEDTKVVIRSCKDILPVHCNVQNKKDKRQQWSTKHYTETKDQAMRTLLKSWVNTGAPEGCAVPAPYVTPVVLLLLQTRW